MAEEDKVVEDKKVDSIVVEDKDEQSSEVQLSPSEEKASSLGWMPLDDWVAEGKDAEDWKPAKVFLEHGDMIGKIRHQSKELEDTKRAVQFMHEKNKEVYQKGFTAAIAQLRAQKREALAEGDLVKADEIDEKIDQHKDELTRVANTPAPVTTTQVDPEHVAWLSRNPWYNDGVMQKFADALAIEYIRVNNGQVKASDVRDYVEQEVKKEFPHKFSGKKTQGAPNPDGDGRGANGKKTTPGLDSKLAKVKSEMTEPQRSIMKNIIRSTGMTEAKYLEMYSS